MEKEGEDKLLQFFFLRGIKKLFKKLDLINNYLFCLAFLGISTSTNLLISIANEIFDDLSFYLLLIGITTGIITLVLSYNLLLKKEIKHKLFALIFIIITILFLYAGIGEFISLFYY